MDTINIREALVSDIPAIQIVRNSVTENQLSNPNLVTDADCKDYITNRGKGWVAEWSNTEIVGFAIVDLFDNNVWALFLHPDFEKKGIGSALHNIMTDWYFSNKKDTLWLSTDKGTRAEQFYLQKGWLPISDYGKTEIKMELTHQTWLTKVR